jgi:hypothetical protein
MQKLSLDVINKVLSKKGATLVYDFNTDLIDDVSDNLDSGYAVAYPHGLVMSSKDTSSYASIVRDWIRSMGYMGRVYFGTWVNDDMIYIDAVRIENDLTLAKLIGSDNGQLAIWDFKNNVEIKLK